MSNIDFNEFKKGKLVVLCETENDFNDFLSECERDEINTNHIIRDEYKIYNENFCFRCDWNYLFYASKSYYEEKGFDIVKYINDNENPMEILLTAENNEYGYGVAVKTENNEIYIKIGNRLLNEDGWLDFKDYDDNLYTYCIYEDEKQYNIKEIMLIKTIFSTRLIKNGVDIEVETIWKREKERVMTLEEIEKELGCKIRIVEK